MMKIMRDMLVIVVLFIAMSKIGETQELQSDDGGIKLESGCYTLVIVTGEKEKKLSRFKTVEEVDQYEKFLEV